MIGRVHRNQRHIGGRYAATTRGLGTIGLRVILALSIFMAALAADAQTLVKIPKVGVLSPGSPPQPLTPLGSFRQGLHDLGYVEGQTILLEYRYAEWQHDRLPSLAAELVQLRPDVIFTWTTPGARAAKQATTTIPIVIGSAADLVGQGLVASLARPGSNITGLELDDELLVGKRFELLKAATPAIARVAVLVNPANPAFDRLLRDATAQTRTLGLQLQLIEARAPDVFDAAFAAMAEHQAEALMIVDDPMFIDHRHRLLDLATRYRLPTVAGARMFADAGSLIAYGRSLHEMFRRAATYVDKILNGTNPADLPVERVPKYELVINLKTAQALGLTIPPIVLFQADEVIK
jgi:putative tryptophan/tyrosine transport system substrate-binding protein